MKDRHWKRMAKVTGYLFDVESPTFTLRNVMEAPLLQFKDDVEVSIRYRTSKPSSILIRLFSLGHLHQCRKRTRHRSETETSNNGLGGGRALLPRFQESRRTTVERYRNRRDHRFVGGQLDDSELVVEQQVLTYVHNTRINIPTCGMLV